jgi:hypothetical protein
MNRTLVRLVITAPDEALQLCRLSIAERIPRERKFFVSSSPVHYSSNERHSRMLSLRLYLHRLTGTDNFALTASKASPVVKPGDVDTDWRFWMQFTRKHIDPNAFGTPMPEIDARILEDGVFRFEGTQAFIARYNVTRVRPIARAHFGEGAITVHLFQCGTEDLFAVCEKDDATALPRSPCTQGWLKRDTFQLNAGHELPVPVIEEVILQGIARDGHYIWRGWTTAVKRPESARDPE